MNDAKVKGHNNQTEYEVEPTGVNAEGKPYSMGPVCFIARSGSWHLQDYFTPDEARALAQALIACADEVE